MITDDIILQISQRLKEVRKEKNITLQEVADIAGVTKGLLSQIENSRTIPSLMVFFNLIKALEIDLNDFFKDINMGLGKSHVIFRKASHYQHFEKENATGFYYTRLFSTMVQDHPVDFVLLRLQKNAKRPIVSTDAFEFKYLLEGQVEYHIGDEKFNMEMGDSIFFDGKELHNLYNTGQSDALMLVVYFFNNPQPMLNIP